jgi:tRNA-modifying protein YgfZ
VSKVTAEYEALHNGIGAVWLPRDVVRVQGVDAPAFLQTQLSQNLEPLTVGETTWSWILQPHGKVDALVRVTRVASGEFLLDTDRRFGNVVIERLHRFLMRTKVEFELLDWKTLGLRGDKAPQTTDVADGRVQMALDWPGMSGVDVMGPSIDVPDDATLCSIDTYEALRIEAGFPLMGAELDERTIPAEADLNDRTISFAKGCYTGQELVARIDARGGNVPRHLRGVIVETTEVPLPGAKIMPMGRSAPNTKPLGQLTSCAFSPGFGKAVGLAFIRRDAMIPCDARLHADEGIFDAHIRPLPLES